MSPRALASAEETWEEFWTATRAVELTEAVGRHAGSLAAKLGLRGPDEYDRVQAESISSVGRDRGTDVAPRSRGIVST